MVPVMALKLLCERGAGRSFCSIEVGSYGIANTVKAVSISPSSGPFRHESDATDGLMATGYHEISCATVVVVADQRVADSCWLSIGITWSEC